MSVTAPLGFRAAGVAAGLKTSGERDVAVVINDGPSRAAAAVFTRNRVKAAPVLWSQQVVAGGRVRAVALNSGGANACTGPLGFQDTHATAERLAQSLTTGALTAADGTAGESAGEIVVCSTGLIGERLPMDLLLGGLDAALGDASRSGGTTAADAIRTTDTVSKIAFHRARGYTVGGMAKGAGMLAPALATMLCVLTTDADLGPAELDQALREATRVTFDRLDTDGCMSTNDTVLLLASGAAQTSPGVAEFAAVLTEVCADLARQLQADAEGASKLIAVEVVGAASEADAVTAGRAVARSNLLKCAVAGEDPNWGRVLSAVGTTDAVFEPERLSVAINGVWVCRNGCAGDDRSKVDMHAKKRDDHRRPVRRAARRHDQHHRPDRRLRARELGVLDMTATVNPPGQDADPAASALAKAETLIEALPWLSRFHGQTVVIKYGGHAMADDELRAAFAQDVVFLRHAGIRPVVVHGGGPQISAHLDRLGVPSTFKAGLRVTSPEAMDVVRMVLTGQVNRDLVGLINRNGPFAIGMSGEDANLFTASRRGAVVDGEPVDLGLVGEIDTVDPGAVLALLRDGRVPVVSSVARGEDGAVYNVNADTAAAALAVALDAAKLVVLTDVQGLYANWRGAGQHSAADVISLLSAAELEDLLPGLSAGMIPKMEACLRAVRGGVPQAHVLDGRLPHSVLLEIFTDSGIGTMVVPDPGPGPAGPERRHDPRQPCSQTRDHDFGVVRTTPKS